MGYEKIKRNRKLQDFWFEYRTEMGKDIRKVVFVFVSSECWLGLNLWIYQE